MSKRYVYKTGKDKDGDITKLCNEGEWWSPRMKSDAISDIESGSHEYYVPWRSGETKVVVIVDRQKGKYLRTVRDGSTGNNLDELPDC